jgi:hypothetical protein
MGFGGSKICSNGKKNTTFGNLKGVDIFKVAKKPIKQMKRLQNPRMVDGDGRNDTKGM